MDPGPIDPSVLYLQELHRSQVVWDHGSEHRMKTRNHNQCREVDPRVEHYLHISGFYGLYQLGFVRMDRSLITALAERWRSETHTFHLPPGECTITLQDVEVICGLSVDGKAVTNDYVINEAAWRQACVLALGVDPGNKVKGGKLNMTWLRTWMDDNPLAEDADDLVVQQRTRGTILLLLGGQYLSDRTGNQVKLQYLPLIMELERCTEYSWGSAILAVMYRELCFASWGGNDIAGPLILLQIWAWIRFSFVRPTDVQHLAEQPEIDDEELPAYPYGYRWTYAAKNFDPETVNHNLRHFRDQFDGMHERQIIWEPYVEILDDLPDYCRAGREIWCTKSVLICFEVVGFYNADRVLRQFGIRQNIPVAAPRDDKLHEHTGKGNKSTRWATKHNSWVEQWDNRRGTIVGGDLHHGYMPVDEQYMQQDQPEQQHQPEQQDQPEPDHHLGDNNQWVDDMINESTPFNMDYELGFDSGYRRRSPPRSVYDYGTQSGELWRSGFEYGHASTSHAGPSQEEEHLEPQTQSQSTEVPRRFRRVSSVNRDVRARRA